MKAAVNVAEQQLYEALIYQELEYLYSRSRKRRKQATDWLKGINARHAVTLEECCDFSDKSIVEIRRIAKGIIDGKLSKIKFLELMKGN